MRILLVFSFLLAAAPAFANANQLVGSCTVTERSTGQSQLFPFRAQAGEKLELGIPVVWEGGRDIYVAEVLNNAGTEHAAVWGALALGFTRPKNQFIVTNPPTLCPAAPEEALLACQAANAALIIPDPATDAFHVAPNSHYAGDIVMPMARANQVHDGQALDVEFGFQGGLVHARCTAIFLAN